MREISLGAAVAIFKDINRTDYSSLEKRKAIDIVMHMPTHNGITKAELINVLKWERGIKT